MINQIVDAISIALNKAFGDGYEIYTESIEQGLIEPCFSILCVNPAREQQFGNRYLHTNKFCIHYFPEEDGAERIECYAMADKLNDVLEYITLGGNLVRGLNMSSEVVDGILHFFVNYDVFTLKKTEKTPMDSVEHNTKVKG